MSDNLRDQIVDRIPTSLERARWTADAIMPLIEEREREAKAEALREAADRMDAEHHDGTWTDWLRDRADEMAEITNPYGDDEEFCAHCYAGVDSSEHHEKCGAP